jgi:hypothetical protein
MHTFGMRYGKWLLIATVVLIAFVSVAAGYSHCPPPDTNPCP